MRRALAAGAFTMAVFAPSFAAQGQTLVDPNHHTNGIEAGGAFAISEISYEAEDTINLERKFVTGTLSYGLMPGFALIAQAGLATDGEIDDAIEGRSVENGQGFLMGIGTKGAFYELDRLRVTGYGMVNYVREDYDDDIEGLGMKARVSLLEAQGGAVAAVNMDGTFKPYAGVEVVPISNGSVETKVDGLRDTADLERDDVLNLKVGMVVEFPEGSLRPEATLLGEQTYTLSGIMRL